MARSAGRFLHRGLLAFSFSLPFRGRAGVGASGATTGHALPAPIPTFPQRGKEQDGSGGADAGDQAAGRLAVLQPGRERQHPIDRQPRP
ncbi:hypothetical protein C4F17_25130 [Variovorax sp. PMC12]|nr:hypothetical protein C4F17_25130 [Variovorax sp. PMC12]